jgi:hypothetical protein
MDMLDVTGQGSASTIPAEPRRGDFVAPEDQQKPQPTQPTQQQPAAGAAAEQGQQADQQQVEPDGWPLHDETGETVGTFPPAQWADEFEKLVSKREGAALLAAIDNNRDTAIKIATECADEIGSIIADGLKAISAFAEVGPAKTADQPTADKPAGAQTQPQLQLKAASPFPEDLTPSGADQVETTDKVVALIKASPSVARVNAILKANASRMRDWTQGNRANVTIIADDKLEDLQRGDVR